MQVFPLSLCPPIGTIQGSGIYISSFTFSAIAVDRYILICHPHKKPLSKGRVSYICPNAGSGKNIPRN